MLAAKSFSATSDWKQLEYWLQVLSAELAARMAGDCTMHNRRPKNLIVHFRSVGTAGRYGSGQDRSRYFRITMLTVVLILKQKFASSYE
jgi:hypothetical protein